MHACMLYDMYVGRLLERSAWYVVFETWDVSSILVGIRVG